MTREELIDHLEHLAEYVKYSEDAPALREVIEMLKCSGNPNGSDTIYRQAAIDAVNAHYDDEYFNFYTVMDILKQLPSAQPEKLYTKADYIMALHKEYGCSFMRAEEAHQKALEYLRNTSIMKG